MKKNPHDVLETNTPPDARPETVLSVIAVGMTVKGDSETKGSLRIDGTIRGDVRAEKSVMIGSDGLVTGTIYTSDAVIAGTVLGAVYAESHLELQATCRVSGEVQAQRMRVEEGAALEGRIALGESKIKPAPKRGQVPSGRVAKAPAPDSSMPHPPH
jgi:cytoskeletal protein CcmA (bactofilin family)